MILVNFHNNYADEFDVFGMKLYPDLTPAQFSTALRMVGVYWDKLAEKDSRGSYTSGVVTGWFGTNEYISFRRFDSGHFNFVDSYTVHGITKTKAAFIWKYTQKKGYEFDKWDKIHRTGEKFPSYVQKEGIYICPLEKLENVFEDMLPEHQKELDFYFNF